MKRPSFKYLEELVSYGLSPVMDEWEARRIRLINSFYIIATSTFIIGIVETYYTEGVQHGNWLVLLAAIFQGGLIPLRLRKIRWAEFYFLFVGNLTLFLFDNLYGPEAGTWLYYFPFMLIIAFMVDFRHLLFASLYVLMSFSFFIAGIFLRYHFLYTPFSKDILASSYKFSFFISGFTMAFVTFIIVRMNYSQYLTFLLRIKERKAAEDSMKMALKEKETLLAEVHHRVKNNLAVISSLLNLQMNVVNNEYTRNVLRESRNRVTSMALIHQKLYQHTDVEHVDFGSYAAELVQEIRNSYPEGSLEKIKVSLDAEHIPLSLTKAVPCGLILNELLSNCYKHAFTNGSDGQIAIHFHKSGGQGELIVADNGAGLPKDFDMQKENTLGMTIIHSLSEQLDAHIEISANTPKGTKAKIVFSV